MTHKVVYKISVFRFLDTTDLENSCDEEPIFVEIEDELEAMTFVRIMVDNNFQVIIEREVISA